MGYSYKAILNKDSRESKTGRHSIFIRVTVDRKSKYFNLDERVDGKYWAGKENRWIRENHPFAFELNAIIKKKMDLLHKFEYRQKLFGNGISLESIADHFRESKTGRHSIFIRVTVDRKSKYFNRDERVDGKCWTGKENRWIRENHPFAFELNAIIKKKMDLLHKFEYQQKLFGNGISPWRA